MQHPLSQMPGNRHPNAQPDGMLAIATSQERLQDAITAAVGFLIRTCAEDGMFAYRIDVSKHPRVINDRYNVIRHAGVACSVLSQAKNRHDQRPVEVGSRVIYYTMRFRATFRLRRKESRRYLPTIWLNWEPPRRPPPR